MITTSRKHSNGGENIVFAKTRDELKATEKRFKRDPEEAKKSLKCRRRCEEIIMERENKELLEW